MSCRVARNRNLVNETKDSPIQVFTKQGEPSILYSGLADRLQTASIPSVFRDMARNPNDPNEVALVVYSYVQTPSFKSKYGDWENNNPRVPLDENGEPTVDFVMSSIIPNRIQDITTDFDVLYNRTEELENKCDL